MSHIPVLYEECLEALKLDRKGCIFVDGTLGGAGHCEGILSKSDGRVIAIDKDDAAFKRCKIRLEKFLDRVTFVKDDFKNIKNILATLNIDKVDGALLDLGVSSFQLDEAERGFSYKKQAPLDMRMDRSSSLSAYEVVNEYSQAQLKQILYEYGEEKFASKIVSGIVKARPIKNTMQLAEVVKNAIPAAARRTGGHPAKRTFQAIRIEVNRELDGLYEAIQDFIDVLAPGGRLAVITFHSLEDRAVKRAFKTAENPCTCPPDFPKCVCGKKPKGKCVNRKPILPSDSETLANNRAHSAKLRIFEKTTIE